MRSFISGIGNKICPSDLLFFINGRGHAIRLTVHFLCCRSKGVNACINTFFLNQNIVRSYAGLSAIEQFSINNSFRGIFNIGIEINAVRLWMVSKVAANISPATARCRR